MSKLKRLYSFRGVSGHDDSRDVDISYLLDSLINILTIHGFAQLWTSQGKWKKVFWVTLFAVCILTLLFHCTIIMMLYYSNRVNVNVDIETVGEMVFPTVTLCNMSPVRKSSLANNQHQVRKKRHVGSKLTGTRSKNKETLNNYLYRNGNKETTVKRSRLGKGKSKSRRSEMSGKSLLRNISTDPIDYSYGVQESPNINAVKHRQKRSHVICLPSEIYFNGWCYWFSTLTFTGNKYGQTCGPNTLSITSQAEQDFIYQHATNQIGYYIGLIVNPTGSQNFAWMNGDTFSYNNWDISSGTSYGCFYIVSGSKWRDVRCNTRLLPICKFDLLAMPHSYTGEVQAFTMADRNMQVSQDPIETTLQKEDTTMHESASHSYKEETTTQSKIHGTTTLNAKTMSAPQNNENEFTSQTTVKVTTGDGTIHKTVAATQRTIMDSTTSAIIVDDTQSVHQVLPGGPTTEREHTPSSIDADMKIALNTGTLNASTIGPMNLATKQEDIINMTTSNHTVHYTSSNIYELNKSCCCVCCIATDCTICHISQEIRKCKGAVYINTNTSENSNSVLTDPPTEHNNIAEDVVLRGEFVTEEQFTGSFAALSDTEKQSLGVQSSEFILDCQVSGTKCYLSDFDVIHNPTYGNCFAFNSGWQNTSLHMLRKPGQRHGLALILNINQDEYVKEAGDTAGVRVVISDHNYMPFPEDEGIFVGPGKATTVALQKISTTRLTTTNDPCLNLEDEQSPPTIYEEMYPVTYRELACLKTCYQRWLIERCECGDPFIPTTGSMFGNESWKACDALNVTQGKCKYNVEREYAENNLTCDCPSTCSDIIFDMEISHGVWPSDVTKDAILDGFRPRLGSLLDDPHDPHKYKRNLLKLVIYMKHFDVKHVYERPAQTFFEYMSSLGGTLGLWIGASIITFSEVLEFIVDVVVLRHCKSKPTQ